MLTSISLLPIDRCGGILHGYMLFVWEDTSLLIVSRWKHPLTNLCSFAESQSRYMCAVLLNIDYLESLPNILQKKYALLHDLDKSLLEIQKQNEERCEREIEDIKRGVKAGNITPDTSLIRFSDEALDEQKHSIRIADEKVALALQAYDLVDKHIQQLDQYLKRFDEEIRREREIAAATALPTPSPDGSAKPGRSSESGRGGRKKTRLATAAAVSSVTEAAASSATNPTGMELDIPVDPNEPTYCFCNQVSYGEMVACDNPDCKIEWFHFGCVGLKEQPKGKWYCSDCATVKNRRKGR
ncbi:PHD finger protein ING1 isoform X1 [Tripterygium wilfordii]|uniref:PHD finger protein ING1 isoform X1 n=1 Tax=Tripterygium wilfordii TaxID=458696 RepID=UPI0018F81DB4|nr:PHD finger protein ING1 isoform X1 [Tripterygium wilfordii]